jgi:hypothetical protein
LLLLVTARKVKHLPSSPPSLFGSTSFYDLKVCIPKLAMFSVEVHGKYCLPITHVRYTYPLSLLLWSSSYLPLYSKLVYLFTWAQVSMCSHGTQLLPSAVTQASVQCHTTQFLCSPNVLGDHTRHKCTSYYA